MTLNNGQLAGATAAYTITPNSGLQSIEWNSETINLSVADINAAINSTSDSSLTIFANSSGAQTDRFEAIAFEQNNKMYIALAASDDNGIATYHVAPNGTLTEVSFLSGADGGYTDRPSGLSIVTVGSKDFLVSVSSSDDSITSFEIGGTGDLTPKSSLGVEQFLPVATPQDVSSLSFLGQSFTIMASSDSSSLTVFTVGPTGTLTAVDQVVDDLSTRMQGANIIETFTIDDRGFVLAAGQDSGISLFSVLPNGQLLHMETVVDQTNFPIDTITDMYVAEVDGDIQLFTVSGSENGIGQFDLDLGTLGVAAVVDDVSVQGGSTSDMLMADDAGRHLDGGNGLDILIDGAGSDTLTGGWAADIFVLGADGQTDTITDFQLGVDRLDLSGYNFLRNVSQLDITSTADGAVITFGDEILVIKTKNGTSLSADDFTNNNTLGATHADTSFVFDDNTNFDDDTETMEDIVNSFANVSGQTGQAGANLTGGAGDDILWGSGGNQTLSGSGGSDVLRGGGGGDALFGGDGIDLADYADAASGVTVNLIDGTQNTGIAAGDTYTGIEGVTGSAHSDTIAMTDDANIVFGGDGDDIVTGLAGDDRLEGGDGRDRLDGGDGDDLLIGGADDDALLGRAGDDTIYAGGGNDNIAAQHGDDLIYGEGGDDNIGGSFGADTIFGGSGDDTIGSGAQDDYINAGLGDDVASGGWGADTVLGGAGSDILAGSYGDDIVRGGTGDDSLGGGTGTDQMYGEDGNDLLGAGDDDDFMFGGNGNDFLGGGSGDDVISGDAGNDRINAGDGDDVMTGGEGTDTYIFNSFTSGEVDTITDFELGMDVIRMRSVTGRFDGLEINAVTIDGADFTEISYDGHKILLADIDADAISVEDFVFIG
ncbi:MAG: calcium-binding protein [Planktomarina sp.]